MHLLAGKFTQEPNSTMEPPTICRMAWKRDLFRCDSQRVSGFTFECDIMAWAIRTWNCREQEKPLIQLQFDKITSDVACPCYPGRSNTIDFVAKCLSPCTHSSPGHKHMHGGILELQTARQYEKKTATRKIRMWLMLFSRLWICSQAVAFV